MKKTMMLILSALFAVSLFVSPVTASGDNAAKSPSDKDRCAVCGMFVAKYPQWISLVELENESTVWFDGVKDMMAYSFAPEAFGAAKGVAIKKMRVKDYYSQQWIDGRQAFYVAGSDVTGPMGHELIPFSSEKAASSFMKDHHGKKLLPFADIDSARIESMRKGHKMKMMHKKKK
jgi:copper chaperone NosL